ncbi:MAG: HEXXH motif-containing putative peptide modification protein [Acidobacteriota bacterium]
MALPWLPGVTADLANTAWHNLDRNCGLTRASYGTARLLRQDPGETRRVVISLDIPSPDGDARDTVLVELLPDDLAHQCAGSGVRFFGASEILKMGVSECLEEAIRILAAVPTVLPTIGSLVRALHLIDPQDDDFDVSFSDPELPFSAFVSIPGPSVLAGPLRVAEAILHEAMHLQLTIAESVVPLVMPSEEVYFSPWRDEYRTAQGVLHALYVFRAIDGFLAASRFEGAALGPLRAHARQRRAMIAGQVRQLRDFRECADLTPDGAAFVDRLLSSMHAASKHEALDIVFRH